MFEQAFATGLFILALLLIVTERLHRTIVIILVVTVLMASGVLTVEEAIHFVDFETLLLLAGMMIIVDVLKELGFFHYVAIRIAKQAGNYKKFFVLMSLAAGLLSPFLDSVTVVLIFSSITVAICRILKKDPKPLLLSQVFCSNIGGNATLIGEPTNVMVATHTGFTFLDFIAALTPVTVICLCVCMLMLLRIYDPGREPISELVADIDESAFIKDYYLLRRAVVIFLLTIALFFIHNYIGLSPAVVALIGAALMLVVIRPDVTGLLSRLEWGTLVFIGGFFIVVGGLTKTGVTSGIARAILEFETTSIGLMLTIGLVAAFGSALIDNIPFVALMIPVTEKLSETVGSTVLWWTLLAGANLGGNLTPIAASPNIVTIAISEREGNPITFKEFFKIGLPVGLTTVLIAMAWLMLMHTLGYM